jgi:hypothetical protein
MGVPVGENQFKRRHRALVITSGSNFYSDGLGFVINFEVGLFQNFKVSIVAFIEQAKLLCALVVSWVCYCQHQGSF